MPQFIKVGTHRINLDHVSEVREFGDGMVRVFWDYCVEGDYSASITAHNDFEGNEAKRLLLILDAVDSTPRSDDESYYDLRARQENIVAQLEALDAHEPVCSFLHCQVSPAEGSKFCAEHRHLEESEPAGVVIQTDEEVAAADRDEIPW